MSEGEDEGDGGASNDCSDDDDDLPCCQLRDVSSSRASHGEAAQGRERHSKINVLWGVKRQQYWGLRPTWGSARLSYGTSFIFT